MLIDDLMLFDLKLIELNFYTDFGSENRIRRVHDWWLGCIHESSPE